MWVPRPTFPTSGYSFCCGGLTKTETKTYPKLNMEGFYTRLGCATWILGLLLSVGKTQLPIVPIDLSMWQ